MRNILDLKKLNKKGQLSILPMSVIPLVVAGVFLVLGLVVLENIRDIDILRPGTAACNATDVSACDIAFNSANDTLVGVGTFADFFTIIVLAIVITLVIGLLMSLFNSRRIR